MLYVALPYVVRWSCGSVLRGSVVLWPMFPAGLAAVTLRTAQLLSAEASCRVSQAPKLRR